MDRKAKLAVIIDDVGISPEQTQLVLGLDPRITLAVLPHRADTRRAAELASSRGSTVLLHLPMQPESSAFDGEAGLLRADMDDKTFDRTLAAAMTSFRGYVGVNNHMGSLLTQDRRKMDRLMARLRRAGLFFVDSRTSPRSVAAEAARAAGLAHAARDVFIDHVVDEDSIRKALAQIERTALRQGAVIAIGHPHQLTIDALCAWVPTLPAKGIDLVAASALVTGRQRRWSPTAVLRRLLGGRKV